MDPEPSTSLKDVDVFLPPRKKRPRKAFTVTEKVMIRNAYKYVKYETSAQLEAFEVVEGNKCMSKVYDILGITSRSVCNVLKEVNKGAPPTPPKKTGPKRSFKDKIDEFTFSAIRRIVHQFLYRMNLQPLQRNLSRNGEDYQKIADVYAGKSVFITGATGFIGKVLVERLLYTCKDIKHIYVMIRQKKGVTLESRLESMFDVPLFSNLKEVRPQDLAKVIPIQGDLLEEQLGINKADQKELKENVDIVFHSAASVMFKDTFRDLMNSNYEGTRKVMELSKRIKNLHAFVYFSTAYSNIVNKCLDEKPIESLASEEEIEHCLKTGDTSRFKQISSAPLYTLSKNLTEVLVEKERGDLPTIMIRPSVVTSTLRDPFPGWMESWLSIPSFWMEHSRGLVSVAIGHKDVVSDIIPCDYVINLAIVAAARGNRTNKMLIYNSSTGSTNPITWKEACDMFREYALQDGQWDLPPRKLILTASPMAVTVLSFIRDRIPALLGDLYLRMRGEKPKYVKFQNRALFMKNSLTSIMNTSLFIKSTQPLLLAQTLDEEDKDRFQFDTNTIKWSEYIHLLYRSIYKYMLNKKKSN